MVTVERSVSISSRSSCRSRSSSTTALRASIASRLPACPSEGVLPRAVRVGVSLSTSTVTGRVPQRLALLEAHVDVAHRDFPRKTTARRRSCSVMARASSTNWRICWWTFVVMTTVLPVSRACSSAGTSDASVFPVPLAPSRSTSGPRRARRRSSHRRLLMVVRLLEGEEPHVAVVRRCHVRAWSFTAAQDSPPQLLAASAPPARYVARHARRRYRADRGLFQLLPTSPTADDSDPVTPAPVPTIRRRRRWRSRPATGRSTWPAYWTVMNRRWRPGAFTASRTAGPRTRSTSG